ncbi:mevalonate kinase [Chthonomonas calidirosea]|uniref:Mevalonate kinase n=1 Tax=Chthonomonas calidirosea (strain DSM 23976 / ICMP 18418 / T49) TaxID=1303518 RepID=S0EWG5_CHTCT|nr:mevalonate kinase [Chthonomonas calidirosea]CCW34043.1 mevalonate kinase [Chthonomonas calidirosea T49]CEK14794.1 mevalonate kinase [Chthonomonas calidirosea]CEK15919.1 mevalonate kinase [Chthonomonas calidirosea]
MKIRAHAPGRCGIVGNPTDMYGGCVLSCTTQERAFCELEPRGEETLFQNEDQHSLVRSKEDLRLRGDKLDILRAAFAYFDIDPGATPVQVRVWTEIPMQAGLAGSTAMLTAIVGAIVRWQNLQFNLYALAETVRKIEARLLGVLCGFQDQHMAVFGGLNFMDFYGKESLEQREDEPLATIEPLTERCSVPPLLLAHTGVQHHSGTVHKSPRQRWEEGDTEVRSGYTRIMALARRGKRALIEQDWQKLGEVMNENHAIVAALGGSGLENDRLIEAALRSGAWGAKLAGAGGGGTIIVLVKDHEKVVQALLDAGAEKLLTPAPRPGLTIEAEN